MSSAFSMENSEGRRTNSRINVEVEPITEDMINKIMELEHIISYNSSVSAQGYADGFEPVVVNEAESEDEDGPRTQGGFMIRGSNENATAMTMPDVSISGVTNTTENIIEGIGILPEDTKLTVVIEKQLAVANDLSVGDVIKIKPSSDSESAVELTVIGIYETTETTSRGLNIAFMQPYNKVYVNITTALAMKETQETSRGGIGMSGSANGIDSVVFTIDDPVNMEQVLADIAKTDINWDKFVVDANNSQYESMMGPINNVASFSMVVVWIVGIAGGVILALILTLWVRERMYETGVLLSLGESRGKIILQYMSEVLIIAILAFTLSIFSGKYIAKGFGEMLLTNELKVNEESQKNNMGPMGGQGRVAVQMRMGPGGAVTTSFNRDVDAIDEIDISIDFGSITKLYIVGLIITLIGTAIPGITVMRLNPKTILTRAG